MKDNGETRKESCFLLLPPASLVSCNFVAQPKFVAFHNSVRILFQVLVLFLFLVIVAIPSTLVVVVLFFVIRSEAHP